MKRKSRALGIAILALTALLASRIAGASEATATPQPKAVIAEPVYVVPTIGKGEKVVHDFVIANEGAAELKILEVVPACGCTVVDFDKSIAPGARGMVHAALDTAAFSGPIAKSITVLTNDPQNPRLELTIQVDVKPYLIAKPGYARFIYVQGLKTGTIAQTVWATDRDDFKVLSVDSPYPFIVATFREATATEQRNDGRGHQWRVEITIRPDAGIGALVKPVVIKTNHPKQREIEIPLSGFVRPLMAATPPVLDFGALALPKTRTFPFALVNFDDDAIEIRGVETNVPGATTSFKVVQAGHRFQVEVYLGPEISKGPVNGVVRVLTTSNKQPVFELPLRGTVQ